MKKLEGLLLTLVLFLPTLFISPVLLAQDIRNSYWGDSYEKVIAVEGIPTVEDEVLISNRMFNGLETTPQGTYFILYRKEFGGQETNLLFGFDKPKGKLVSVGWQLNGEDYDLYKQILSDKYGSISGYSEWSFSWLTDNNNKIILYKSVYFPEHCYLTFTDNSFIMKERRKLYEEKLKGL